MKKTVLTLTIVGIILTVMAFTKSEKKSEGAIGDVKYSILSPEKFKEENGNGWVLMDDKIALEGSDLKNKHGILELPDARGLFIRGLHLTRNDGKGDSDEGINRKVGSYQNETNAAFSYNGAEGTISNHARNHEPGTGIARLHNHFRIESRPENIALYIYIKINE
jgi:hypothetical protein